MKRKNFLRIFWFTGMEECIILTKKKESPEIDPAYHPEYIKKQKGKNRKQKGENRMKSRFKKLAASVLTAAMLLQQCGVTTLAEEAQTQAETQIQTQAETPAPETQAPQTETSAPETKVPETEAPSNDNSYVSDGKVLSKYHGVVYGPTGKETYYNLDMSGVVRIMRDMGFSAEDYPYWVRDDGCKMLGSYIMCAANLNYFPRGTTVASSLGTCLVCDTGSFAASNPTQLDIATNW